MKWHRKITSALFQKEDPINIPPKKPKVLVNGSWGLLKDLEANGQGYIKFDDGSGQIINNWNHFLELVEKIETEF